MTNQGLTKPARRSQIGSMWRGGSALAAVGMLALSAGCGGGGDDGTERSERASTGPGVAPVPVAPADPPDDGGDEPGASPGGAVDFADVFGPPTGRLGGGDPETTDPPPTVPPSTEPAPAPAPPPTQPPAAPAPTTPPAPAPAPTDPGAPAPVRTPVAPLAPDVLTFLSGLDAVNAAINAEEPSIARLSLPYEAFSLGESITIPGGQVAALRLEGGVVAVLLDTDNTVAAALVYGAASAEVVSAVISIVFAHGDEPARNELLAGWDAAIAANSETVFPDSDGGQWSLSSTDGVASLAKFQDANTDWVTANHILFELDAVVVLPSPTG